MKIYEFGKENKEVIVLIHPSVVAWDYFERVIPLLKKDHHLLVPALPGYDLTNSSGFTSVEKTASDLADQLIRNDIKEVKAVYGCSMGGSIALRMAADHKLKIRNCIMDGGITPYQLPRILTRFIALRDFAMMAVGKLGGEKLMIRAFSGSRYSEDDLKYISDVLNHCSYRTLWNTFDSCNNYRMPKRTMRFSGKIRYWYGEKERKARDWDIRYMKRFIPQTVFQEFKGMDHGDMAYFCPEILAEEIGKL